MTATPPDREPAAAPGERRPGLAGPRVGVVAEQLLRPVPGGVGRYGRALATHLPVEAAVDRGTVEFLGPANQKVLAYIRKLDGDVILCVANLSRTAQPAELDLQVFAGMTPIEMLGYTEFPPIGELPYFLTLGPYGFYWFELQRARS